MPDQGPWTQFQSSALPAGPWTKFASQPDPDAPRQSSQLSGKPKARRPSMASDVMDFGRGVALSGAGMDDFLAHLLPVPGLAANVDKRLAGLEANDARMSAAEGRTGPDIPNLLGQFASPVNFTPVGRLGAGVGLAEKLGKLALQGGIAGAASPVQQTGNYLADKFKQITAGAAGSMAGGALLHGAGAMLRRSVSPEADKLIAAGVKLTPGQLAGGVAKRAEDALSSVPILGSAIRSGQNAALKSFNIAAINRALAPIGAALPKGIKAGHEAIEYARQTLGNAYDDINSKMIGKLDQPFQTQVMSLAMLAKNLPDKEFKQFGRIVQDEVLSKFTAAGVTTGSSVKEIESTLGKLAKPMLRSDDYDVKRLGGAVSELRQAVVEMRDRVNPALAGEIQKLNAGWANFKRVQRAASSVGAEDGVFSPSHLMNAVKAGDASKDKGRFAEGSALMQDMADAGKKVLPQKLRDSGTSERAAWMGAAGLAGDQAMHNPLGVLMAGVTAAAGSLPYTSAGMALLTKFAGPQTRNYLAHLVTSPTPYLTGGLGVTRAQPINDAANN